MAMEKIKDLVNKLNQMRSGGTKIKVRTPEEYEHDVKKPSNDEYELAKYKEEERQNNIKEKLKEYKRARDKDFLKPDSITSQPNSISNVPNNFAPKVNFKAGVEKRLKKVIGGGMTIGKNSFQPQNDENILNAGNSFFSGSRPIKQSRYQNVFIR